MNVNKKLLAVLLIAFLVGIAGAVAYTYHMRATVGGPKIETYLDVDCNNPLPTDYDWENVLSGDVKPIWIKNEGTQDVTVNLAATNLVGCTIAFSINDFPLNVDAVQKVDMTITTAESVGTPISWDVAITTIP